MHFLCLTIGGATTEARVGTEVQGRIMYGRVP